jgi:pimeloyl-ACP methyl ester carboxylesterase
MPEFVTTPLLEMAYESHGPPDGTPVILLHGFPDDPRAYDEVWLDLEHDGYRVIVPWLRGYGETHFLSPSTMRSGQQATLGADLLALMDALSIGRAYVAGYDWGGRAACIAAALWPARVLGLVTCGGYNIQDIANAGRPTTARAAYRQWYQWYFNMEAGRRGLTENRREICRLLWELWCPNYHFDDATFEAAAVSFDNPDFVGIVIHSYRHRQRNAEGDPSLDGIEARLAAQPDITVPTIALQGAVDGPTVIGEDRAARHFSGPYERRVLADVGHFIPREAPAGVVQAIRDLERARAGA